MMEPLPVVMAADAGRKSNEKRKKVVVERSRECRMDAPAVYSFTLTGFLASEPFERDRR